MGGRIDVWTRRALGAVLCLGLAGALLLSLNAGAAELSWQPGFPMRAGNQVLLMWLPVPGAQTYRVVRRDLRTREERTWTVTAPQHVDPEAPPTATYLYTVEALGPAGAVLATSEPKKLEGFRPLEPPEWGGHYVEGRSVHLVWGAVEGAVFYNLYRSKQGEEPALLASVQDVKYVDATVEPGATYTYTVRAVGLQSQESADSKPLSVRVGEAGAAEGEAKATRRTVEVAAVFRETTAYRLREPTDLTWSDRTLFVTDLGSRSVVALDGDGNFLYRFATEPPGYEGAWGIPWGIGVSDDGERIAVTFLRSPNVRVFSRTGDLLLDVPVPPPKGYEDYPKPPQPMDVALDAEGGLWVTEYTFAQVVHLGRSGREIGRTGIPRPADDAGPFRSPTFLAAHTPMGRVVVVDSLLARLFVLDRDGQVVIDWTRTKTLEGPLDLPKGVCVTPAGDLLVVDGIRSSLQTFSLSGEIREVFYSRDKDYLDLRGLVSAAVDPRTGDLFALSKVDSAIYRLRIVP
ncbi:NHL repeat-containing protein [Deferrisoma palaeochoriense]